MSGASRIGLTVLSGGYPVRSNGELLVRRDGRVRRTGADGPAVRPYHS
jgi:hypothetical protein